MTKPESWAGWAVVEIMGHRKLVGLCRSPGGPGALATMLRIDIYVGYDKAYTTQFYGATAIFSVLPTAETVCREMTVETVAPINQWEMPESWRRQLVSTSEPIDAGRFDPIGPGDVPGQLEDDDLGPDEDEF